MTGYTVHTGSTVKFADGWDQVFGSKTPSPKKSAGTQAEPVSTHVHSQAESRKKKKKSKKKTHTGKTKAQAKGATRRKTASAKNRRGKKK